MDLQKKLTDRFLRYAAIPSQSDPWETTVPSTPGQRELARLLAEEMAELGLVDISISEESVVIGRLPARLPEGHAPVPRVGWVAHLDTVDVHMSPEIHPQLIRSYDGGDICQNPQKEIWLRVSDHPELGLYAGQDILVSDGTSVLGADNKAAIANIMTALEVLRDVPERPTANSILPLSPTRKSDFWARNPWIFPNFPWILPIPSIVARRGR